MNFIIFILLLLGCSKKADDQEKFGKEYVLIEFAAKLEEDYHRMDKKSVSSPESHPGPIKNYPAQ